MKITIKDLEKLAKDVFCIGDQCVPALKKNILEAKIALIEEAGSDFVVNQRIKGMTRLGLIVEFENINNEKSFRYIPKNTNL